LFDATDGGELVDSLVYHAPTAAILIGKAMTHQELLGRFADDRQIDNYVRADLFRRPFLRLELDSWRAAVPFDDAMDTRYADLALRNIFAAIRAFVEAEMPQDMRVFINGIEVKVQ